MTMDAEQWHHYLRAFQWEHPPCRRTITGVAEVEPGRLTGYCDECHESVLVFIWGDGGWIDAQLNSIILETD